MPAAAAAAAAQTHNICVHMNTVYGNVQSDGMEHNNNNNNNEKENKYYKLCYLDANDGFVSSRVLCLFVVRLSGVTTTHSVHE